MSLYENCKRIFASLPSGAFAPTVELASVIDVLEIRNALSEIERVINVEFPMLIVDPKSGTQRIQTTSFREMLNEIEKEDVHTKEINGVLHTCDFHKETLWQHLHLAMCEALVFSITHGARSPWIAGLTALLHDIGKPAVAEAAFGNNKWMAYPAHGELGAGILRMAFSSDAFDMLTMDEKDAIVRAVGVHMCGYHDTDATNAATQYRWSMLSTESASTRSLLVPLRRGDTRGVVTDVAKNLDAYNGPEFENALHTSLDVDDFAEKNDLYGMMFLIRGPSAAGKTSATKHIIAMCERAGLVPVHIERDAMMYHVVASVTGKPCTDYAEAYTIYKDRKLGPRVNDLFAERIERALIEGKVPIVDTVMSLHDPIQKVLGERARKAMSIAVDVLRTSLLTDADGARRGLSLKQQMEVFGERTTMSWLPRSKRETKMLSSLSSTRGDLSKRSKFQPRLVFPVTWTEGFNLVANAVDTFATIGLRRLAEKDTSRLSLIEYINSLSMNLSALKAHFAEHRITAMPPSILKKSGDVISVKYLEHCNLWTRWAREARGMILLKHNGKWINLKHQLQRGAEMLTGMHARAGIKENENLTDLSSFAHFDHVQQDTLRAMLNGGDLEAEISFKVDGSLLSVTAYTGDVRTKVEALLHSAYNATADAILRACKGKPRLIVPSTQGTFVIPDVMLDYMVEAIAAQSGIVLDYSQTPLHQFENVVLPVLAEKMDGLISHLKGDTRVVTLCLEAVCKNRKSGWADAEHTELAVRYPFSGVFDLGVSYGTDTVTYLPHFAMPAVFCSPAHWSVKSAKEIEAMLAAISQVARSADRAAATADFFSRFPPTSGEARHIDFEGFVLYTVVRDGDAVRYDYGKIKTEEYYRAHKPRSQNVAYLIELSHTAADIFPLAAAAASLYTDRAIVHTAMDAVHSAYLDIASGGYKKFDPRIVAAIDGRSGDARASAIAGNANAALFDAAKSVLGNASKVSIRNLIDAVRPWHADYHKRIDALPSDGPIIASMFSAMAMH